MSLPRFSTQAELFSTAGLSASLFAPTDRYRLFAQLVYPRLVAQRDQLAKGYCADNGRVALEPVLMLGVSILQDLDGMPDRQAVEMLHYHAGWNFALNRPLGDEVFHPTSLVNFRNRLPEQGQSALGFQTILEALVLSSAPTVTTAPGARAVWAKTSGTARWGSASLTARCQPAARNSRPRRSKRG